MGGKSLCFTSPARLSGLYNAAASNLQSACQPAVQACQPQVACRGIHVRQEALLCYHVDVMVILAGMMT